MGERVLRPDDLGATVDVIVIGGGMAGLACAVSLSIALAILAPTPARAASVTIAAGEARTLDADIVLTGADSLTAGAPGGARCTIHGGGHSIRAAAAWTAISSSSRSPKG